MSPFVTPPIEDAAAMAVLSELLSSRGDPRGELVRLHLAREWSRDARVARAADEHLARNDRALLGGLRTLTAKCELAWFRGYIVQARVHSMARPDRAWRRGRWEVSSPRAPDLPRVVRELLKLESAVTLQSLTVVLPDSSLAREELHACADEVEAAAPRSLRVLELHALQLDTAWPFDEDRWVLGPTEQESLGELQVRRSVG